MKLALIACYKFIFSLLLTVKNKLIFKKMFQMRGNERYML